MSGVLVPGRFAPLHLGHLSVIDTASSLGTPLVCVAGPRSQPRSADVAAARPGVTVEPWEDAPDWRTDPTAWGARFAGRVARVIGSDPAVVEIARAAGAAHTVLDPDRFALPCQSSELRADPVAHWNALAGPVRARLQKRLTFVGPESSGKSTLARALADKLGGPLVPEYGRPYEQHRGSADYAPEELFEIARVHAAHRAALASLGPAVLIEDTDPLFTCVWAEMLLGRALPELEREVTPSDAYALLHWDAPWAEDPLRYFATPEERRAFFDRTETKLRAFGARYRVLGGSLKERETDALAFAKDLADEIAPMLANELQGSGATDARAAGT